MTGPLLAELKESFLTHLRTTYALANHEALILSINDDPKKSAFGDLSTNAAMVIAKIQKKAPIAIAQELVAQFKHPLIASATIAGPGFVNFTLTDKAFVACSNLLFTNHRAFFAPYTSKKPRHYSVEYVSANPTGPLHLGHGRGGIIGDVLSTILTFEGEQVNREFYINDAGKQIQTLGLSLKIRCQQALGETVELPEDAYQGEYLKTMAQRLITTQETSIKNAITSNDIAFFGTYAKEQLLAEQRETLKEYHVTFDTWFSEKTLHQSDAIEKALQRLIASGHTFEAEGALWFRSTSFGDDKDRVLRKANGELTYVAADIAYLLNKIERGAEKLILVLGQDHHSYVVRLKGIMAALGFNPDNLDVILYQLVTLKEDGELVRMSKRAGRIVSLQDIIETVGTDVARFFYLNRKADAHLEFDVTLALKKTEENPVYYLQYAYVRTKSIFEKATSFTELDQLGTNDLHDFTEAEKLLLRKIFALGELLQNISTNYQVHLLAYYTLELATIFHKFYATERVIDPEQRAQSRRRLALVMILQKTLSLCFDLLGISKPEEM